MGRTTKTIKWNKLPPKAPGFYWIAEKGEQPHVVLAEIVLDTFNKVEILLPGDQKKYPVGMWPNALWCGPLKAPE